MSISIDKEYTAEKKKFLAVISNFVSGEHKTTATGTT